MTWEDPRPATRATSTAARGIAHSDQAKHRVDESATRVRAPRPRPKWLVPALASAGVLVVLAGGGALAAMRGSDSDGPSADPTSGPSATSPSPSPEEVLRLEDTQPRGPYQVTTKYLLTDLRGGGTRKEGSPPKPGTWTFNPKRCTGNVCVGTIASSSGNKFAYVYDGTGMTLARKPARVSDPKAACVDDVTGEVQPIEASAAIAHYRIDYEPISFVPGEGAEPPLKASWRGRSRVTYTFFGDCEPGPKDTVQYNNIITIKRK